MTKLNCSASRSALLFSLALTAAAPAYASDALIGTVDVVKLLNTAPATSEVQRRVEEESAKLRNAAQNQQGMISAERNALESKRGKLSAADLQKKQNDFAQKVASIQQSFAARQDLLKKVFDEASNKTQAGLDQAYKKVAAAHGFAAVLNKNAVLYASEGSDVTDEVLTEFNKAVPKIELNIPKEQ